jgi:hypothetical protein
MLGCKDIPTWIAGIDDNHSHCILIRKSFDRIKINLPTLFGQKIEVASFKVTATRTSFILRVTWSGQQNVGARARKDRYHNFYCLRTTNGEMHIIC